MTHGQRCTFSVGNVRVVSNLPFASATSALPWFRERERKKEKKKREREKEGVYAQQGVLYLHRYPTSSFARVRS